MNNNGVSKSQIFLLEFIIVVLFFAICATVCVTAFVKSDALSRENAAKNEAISRVESAAEIVKLYAEGKDPVSAVGAALEEKLGAVDVQVSDTDGTYDDATLYEVYYAEDFTQTDVMEDVTYTMHIVIKMDGSMLKAEISADDSTKPKMLFAVNVEKYVPLAESEGQHD